MYNIWGGDIRAGMLNLVRNIIERLGGQVGIRSIPGQGSTFWFGLPLSPTTQSGENQRE